MKRSGEGGKDLSSGQAMRRNDPYERTITT